MVGIGDFQAVTQVVQSCGASLLSKDKRQCIHIGKKAVLVGHKSLPPSAWEAFLPEHRIGTETSGGPLQPYVFLSLSARLARNHCSSVTTDDQPWALCSLCSLEVGL